MSYLILNSKRKEYNRDNIYFKNLLYFYGHKYFCTIKYIREEEGFKFMVIYFKTCKDKDLISFSLNAFDIKDRIFLVSFFTQMLT